MADVTDDPLIRAIAKLEEWVNAQIGIIHSRATLLMYAVNKRAGSSYVLTTRSALSVPLLWLSSDQTGRDDRAPAFLEKIRSKRRRDDDNDKVPPLHARFLPSAVSTTRYPDAVEEFVKVYNWANHGNPGFRTMTRRRADEMDAAGTLDAAMRELDADNSMSLFFVPVDAVGLSASACGPFHSVGTMFNID